jgi:RNA polymerase sigma-70 factor (ECF subfamily)
VRGERQPEWLWCHSFQHEGSGRDWKGASQQRNPEGSDISRRSDPWLPTAGERFSKEFPLGLNLFSPAAFHSLKMLMVEAQEQSPVAAARAGRTAAWDALFARYQMPVYVYVMELVRDEQTSLDLVQETFISAARHIGRLLDDEKFGSWLFSIAHQKVIQHWRRRAPDERLDEETFAEHPDEDADPREWLFRQEREKEFTRILDRLSEEHRAVLLLHFLEDFSIEEIATVTGAQTGTVKSRLHYAKRALRKLLEEDAP